MPYEHDLHVLVADADCAGVLGTLLANPRSLRIRSITWTMSRHAGRDPGRRRAEDIAIRRAPARRKPRRAPAWFADLAGRVPTGSCRDPAFVALRRTLRQWFPAERPPPGP